MQPPDEAADRAPLGVYVHFPWCRQRCPYCDFAIAVAPLDQIPHEPYADAVVEEFEARAEDWRGRTLVSIYFGGGTPGLWSPACLARVVQRVQSRFAATEATELEITLEVNPTDCRPAALAAWRAAGINRLSIGVQSFDPGELIALGRDHRLGDGAAALEAARAAGFERISVDVIFGTPGSRAGHGLAAVERAAALGPPHLSVYELTVEPRTPLGAAVQRGDVRPLDDDVLADLYLAAHERLRASGYEHYEVSSYARPGHRAVHNALYWSGGEYLGLGNGAASFRRTSSGAVRATNARSVTVYLRGGAARVADVVESDEAALAQEILWLSMRTRDGAPESAFARVPGVVERLLADGLAEQRGGRICPTVRGFLYADTVAARIAAAGTGPTNG